jgi:hypothetical protein
MRAPDDPCFSVVIYLRGHDLDPEAISEFLRTIPTKGWKRGDEFENPRTGDRYIRKNGLWQLSSDDPRFGDAPVKVEDHVERLLGVLADHHGSLAELGGVEDAFLDFFFASEPGAADQGFWLDQKTVQRIGSLGLAICATFAATEP